MRLGSEHHHDIGSDMCDTTVTNVMLLVTMKTSDVGANPVTKRCSTDGKLLRWCRRASFPEHGKVGPLIGGGLQGTP